MAFYNLIINPFHKQCLMINY